MYFKNKTTGITWHITDETHIKRLKNDKSFEALSDNKTNTVDYKSIDWNELRKIAADKGINTKGKKRDEIESELAKLGDEDVTN